MVTIDEIKQKYIGDALNGGKTAEEKEASKRHHAAVHFDTTSAALKTDLSAFIKKIQDGRVKIATAEKIRNQLESIGKMMRQY